MISYIMSNFDYTNYYEAVSHVLILSKEEFTCNDGSCCSASFRCDGKPDCQVVRVKLFDDVWLK